MNDSRWQDYIRSAYLSSDPLWALSGAVSSCDYLDRDGMNKHQKLILREREAATLGSLDMKGEDDAMLRLVLDEHALKRLGRRQHSDTQIVDLVDPIEHYLTNELGAQRYVGYYVAHHNSPEPAVYLDFQGPGAKDEALQLYTQIQSAIEQRKSPTR